MKIRKVTLIEDWKKAWRFISVQVSAAASMGLVAWVAMPEDQQHAILAAVGLNTPAYFALAAFAAVVLGRLISQAPKE
jgi:hypothetical protein